MKTLKDIVINESKNQLTYNLRHDVYNILSDMCFQYEKKHMKIDEFKLESAVKYFIDSFIYGN